MARKSKRPAPVLAPDQTTMLKELAASRKAPAREVARAKGRLGYVGGTSITPLHRQLGFSRPMIYRCIDKALAAGMPTDLKDQYHRPHEPEITDEAKALGVRHRWRQTQIMAWRPRGGPSLRWLGV